MNGTTSNTRRQQQWPDWAREDLARSGITTNEAVRRGCFLVTATEYSRVLGFSPRGASEGYFIPYLDPDAGSILKARERPYGRVRLRTPLEHNGETVRYLAPINAGQHAFILAEAHAHLSEDLDRAVLLTEGEKKAWCATLHGLPMIGLPGNWGWKADKDREDLAPELNRYLVHKVWLLIWDSDGLTNPRFWDSSVRLARLLKSFGCRLFTVYLPKLDAKGKTGVDDFLMAQGQDVLALRAFIDERKCELKALGFTQIHDALASRPDVTAAEKLVYGRIRRYALMVHGAIPSNDRLASDLGLSERHVQRITADLAKKGLLRRERRPGRSNRYHPVDPLHASSTGT